MDEQLQIAITRIDKLNHEAYEIRNTNRTRSFEITEAILQESREIDYQRGEAEALRTLGTTMYRSDRVLGLQFATEALRIFDDLEDDGGAATALMVMFCFHNDAGSHELAFEIVRTAYDRAMKGKNPVAASVALFNLGVNCEHRQDWDLAATYYQRGAELAKRHGAVHFYLSCRSGYGYILAQVGRPEEAIKIFRAVLPRLQKDNYHIGVLDTYSHMADAYQKLGRFDMVSRVSRKALRYADRVQMTDQAWSCIYEIGQAELGMNRPQKAIEYYLEALSRSNAIGHRNGNAKIHLALSKVYRALGDFGSALNSLEHYVSLREMLFTEKSEARIRDLQVLHQVEMAQAEASLAMEKSEELENMNKKLRMTLVQKDRLQRELFHLASTDELTGTLNRRQFINEGLLEMEKFHHIDEPFSVLVIDVDHFKSINDSFGHPAGDEALRRIAKTGRKDLRKSDIFGRIGGEEFAIVLPAASVGTATQIASRFLKNIETMDISDMLPGHSLTVSIGICAVRNDHKTFFDVMSEADQALYDAKKAGRNQYQIRNDHMAAA